MLKETVKYAQVAGVKVDKGRKSYFGTLHILAHHLLFCAEGSNTEIWISYSTVQSVDRKAPSAQGLHSICVTCRNFQFVRLHIANERDATEVFASLQRLINIMTIEQTYAFSYQPAKPYPAGAKWRMFDPAKEFARLGVNTLTDQWRFTTLNENYEFSPTYPRCMVVPAKISDNVLRYTGKFRSKARIPALSYLHRPNMASITRSSQPLVGLKQNRSIQDEKLVEAIFSSCIKTRNASSAAASASTNLIVDARPTANAMAQTALGAGTESVENYRDCQIVFLGIDNIHVVRDSLYKLTAVMNSVETGPVPKAQLHKSGWLKHIRHILDGSATMVKQVHLQNSHVLVHCSDGWDRTAQLCSLAEICLDPYYRTIEGFAVLIEKEWISFGHKFRDRCGHLSRDSNSQPSHAASVGAQLQAARRNVSNSLTSVAKGFFAKNIGGLSFGAAAAPSLAPSPVPLGTNTLGSSPTLPSRSSTHSPAFASGSNDPNSSQGQEPLASVETAVPNSVAPREVSPVFTQFLDCVYQLWTQFPTHFEFSERLLSALHLHVYACQYGNFLFNCERELLTYRVPQTGKDIENATNSVWNHILHGNTDEYLNPLYVPPAGRLEQTASFTQGAVGAGTGPTAAAGSRPGAPGTVSPDGIVLYPSTANLKYWAGLCLREEEIEMDREPAPFAAKASASDEEESPIDPGDDTDDGVFVPLTVPSLSHEATAVSSNSPSPRAPRSLQPTLSASPRPPASPSQRTSATDRQKSPARPLQAFYTNPWGSPDAFLSSDDGDVEDVLASPVPPLVAKESLTDLIMEAIDDDKPDPPPPARSPYMAPASPRIADKAGRTAEASNHSLDDRKHAAASPPKLPPKEPVNMPHPLWVDPESG
ncbi:hypothetical protein HDU89_008861 [Geranomyces variabilis]|nr:hypothetical protein HDU89_008861 [Geranomyces variabilis]